jgi:hypothetical protein
MSSVYSPYGGVPTQLCQRCGAALPPNESYCGNCGYFNPPAQMSPFAASPGPESSNVQWGTSAAPTAPDQSQYGAAQWGQQWGQPAQGNAYAQPSFPQQPNAGNYYGAPAQSGGYAPHTFPQQPNAGNYYGTPAKPVNSGNLYGNPSQAMDAGGYFNTPAPAQPFYGSPATSGNLQPGLMGAPQARPGRSKTALVVSAAIFIIVLIGGSIGGYLYIKKHGSPNASTSSIMPSPTPKGPALFSDPFNNNTDGWNLQGEPGKFSVALGGGALTLEDDDNHMLWELVPGNKTFSDFKLFVDATLSRGDQVNGYGIYIRGASNQNTELATYYRFELYGDGSYAIFKGTVDASGNSNSSLLVNYTSDSAIQPQGSVNHIEIVANGSSLTLIVNGQTLKTVSDSSYTSGSVALFVSNVQNAKPGAQAKFSNFAIYPANA